MFCVKCGNKLEDGAAFCTGCGARQSAEVPNAGFSTPQPAPGPGVQPNAAPMGFQPNQPAAAQSFQPNQPAAAQPFQPNQPAAAQPFQPNQPASPQMQPPQQPPMPPYGQPQNGFVPPVPPKAPPKRKSPLPAILAVVVIFAALAAGGWYFLKGAASGSEDYKALGESYFDAVNKQDFKALAKCYDKDDAKDLTDDKKSVMEDLKTLQENFVDVAGKKWRADVEIGKAEKLEKDGDTTTYTLPVTIGESETSMIVKKVDGRYYVAEACQPLSAGAAGAGDVILRFFQSIADGDVNGFKACFDETTVAMLEEQYTDDDISSMIEEINASGIEESGEDWISKIKIQEVVEDTEMTDSNANGRTYYSVTAVIEGETEDVSEPIVVFEEGGNFYIDVEAMGGLF